VKRLSTPLISTEALGYFINEAAEILARTAFHETKRQIKLKGLRLVFYSPYTYSFFSEETLLLLW
jgi:hypothetical protein